MGRARPRGLRGAGRRERPRPRGLACCHEFAPQGIRAAARPARRGPEMAQLRGEGTELHFELRVIVVVIHFAIAQLT